MMSLRATLPARIALLALAIATLVLLGTGSLPGVDLLAAQQNRSLAPYVPTPQDVVDRMLSLAGVTGDDVVYDLGCGDGRIVITAAQRYGARGVGIDFDPQRIAESNANAERAGVRTSCDSWSRTDAGRLRPVSASPSKRHGREPDVDAGVQHLVRDDYVRPRGAP